VNHHDRAWECLEWPVDTLTGPARNPKAEVVGSETENAAESRILKNAAESQPA